jgi:hypothetical protein
MRPHQLQRCKTRDPALGKQELNRISIDITPGRPSKMYSLLVRLTEKHMKFPEISGSNLLRQKITLPDDLQGELNILLVAFHRWHQDLVDTWVPAVDQLEGSYSGVRFYEIPVIQNMNFVYRTFINEGMRAGIPNQATRQKTITLYLNKEEFRRAVDIPDESTIWVLVVDRQGNILWRTEGAYTQEKGDALLNAITTSISAGQVSDFSRLSDR